MLLRRPSVVAPSLPRLHESFSAIVRQHTQPIVSSPNTTRGLAPAVGCAVVKTDTGAYGMHAEGLRYFPADKDPAKMLPSPRTTYTEMELDALRNTQLVDPRAKQAFVDAEVDRWHWGSNCKSISAVTIRLCLEERGLSTTKVTVGEVLGSKMAVPESLKSVTMQQLLDHRSGLDDRIDVYNISFSSLSGWRTLWKSMGSTYHGATTLWQEHRFDADPAIPVPPVGEQRRLVVERLFTRWNASNVFNAGIETRRNSFGYSNFGYLIAALMVETLVGSEFELLVRDLIFEPLQMETAGFGEPYYGLEQPNVRGHDHDLAWSLGIIPSRLKYYAVAPANGTALPPALNPAGNMHSTLLDFCRWEQYQSCCLRDHLAEKKRAIKEKQQDDVHFFYETKYDVVANQNSPFSCYSSGLIKMDEMAQRRAQLEEEKKSNKKRSGDEVIDPTADLKSLLGEHWLHDGSNGVWHALHVIVPRRNIAGCMVANTSNVALPGAMMSSLREAMLNVLNDL